MRIITSLSSIIYNERRAGMLIRQPGMMWGDTGDVIMSNKKIIIPAFVIWNWKDLSGKEAYIVKMNVIIKSSYSSTPVEISQSTWTSFKCFFYYYFDSALPLVVGDTCQPFPVHDIRYCDCWTFHNPNQCWIFCPEMRGPGRGKTRDIKVTNKKLPGAENQYGKK